jgi:PAS domain-containing protein
MQKKNKNNVHNDSFSALIDLIPDPVIVIDSVGKLVASNKIMLKFSGYKSDQPQLRI